MENSATVKVFGPPQEVSVNARVRISTAVSVSVRIFLFIVDFPFLSFS